MSFPEFILSYSAVLLTATIAAYTPGPNNIMIIQSTTLFGYKRTIPHILGVIFGFVTMFIIMSMGLRILINYIPIFFPVLKVAGTLFFIWLAYRIVTMDIQEVHRQVHQTVEDKDTSTSRRKSTLKTKPLTFFQAFFFQWINVKSYFFTIGINNAIPRKDSEFYNMFVLVTIIFINTIFSANLWAFAGVLLNRIIKHTMLLRMINAFLGLSLLWFCVRIWV